MPEAKPAMVLNKKRVSDQPAAFRRAALFVPFLSSSASIWMRSTRERLLHDFPPLVDVEDPAALIPRAPLPEK